MGILKVRNMLLLIALGYGAITTVMMMSEHGRIQTAVGDVRNTVMLAADAALTQVAASDEFFTTLPEGNQIGAEYDTGTVTTLRISKNTADRTYTESNIFAEVWGYNEDNPNWQEEKEALFLRMYGNETYSALANAEYMRMAEQITFKYNDKDIPNIARMGLFEGRQSELVDDAFTGSGFTKLWETIFGSPGLLIEKKTYDSENWGNLHYAMDTDWLGFFDVNKGTKNEPYFLAPTNVGVTYIDPTLLQTAFVCNMDLLMRSKYDRQLTAGENDLGIAAGVGIPTTGFEGIYSNLDAEAQAVVDEYNIIHNGMFSFVKGTFDGYANGVPGGFTGGSVQGKRVIPTVEYQLIKLRDEQGNVIMSNANLVCTALGVNMSNKTYAEWVIANGTDDFLLAKITFYADVFVPYSTQIARELYHLYEREPANTPETKLFQVHNMGATTDLTGWKISDITGNALYEYTTYFAVMA